MCECRDDSQVLVENGNALKTSPQEIRVAPLWSTGLLCGRLWLLSGT